MSQSDMRLHFGLGTAQTVEEIDIRWPLHNSATTIKNVKANQFLTIVEGGGVISVKP
jgi:hypothetical protein